ncbi:hypothetical protein ACWD4O_36940 [Streptomyces sp. NPDC002623]
MSDLAAVLLTAAFVMNPALPVAAATGKLARLEGAGHPAAMRRAALAFAGSPTLVAAVTGALERSSPDPCTTAPGTARIPPPAPVEMHSMGDRYSRT